MTFGTTPRYFSILIETDQDWTDQKIPVVFLLHFFHHQEIENVGDYAPLHLSSYPAAAIISLHINNCSMRDNGKNAMGMDRY